MEAYTGIINNILTNGVLKHNRTGVNTIAIAGATFEHEMSEGFPILTTKKMGLGLVASELEFFIKGKTDKSWLQERNNHIWDEWCSPDIVPYGNSDEIKEKMKHHRDLGPIYGFQWRYYGAEYKDYKTDYTSQGIDQLQNLVDKIKENPDDRRMIVTAWNPKDLHKMALPPCHLLFQVTVIDGKLNLMWYQRSVDSALGLPFNIASYGLLLHLLAKETGLQEGKLTGSLGDTHIYVTHKERLEEQVNRTPWSLPTIKTDSFKSIFDWEYTDSKLVNYHSHDKIDYEIAV